MAFILVAGVALAGPLLGWWKIDSIALGSLLIGVFVLLSPMLSGIHFKILGFVFIIMGIFLWTDGGGTV